MFLLTLIHLIIIVLSLFAGVVQWQDACFPSMRREFDPHHPYQLILQQCTTPLLHFIYCLGYPPSHEFLQLF